MRQFAFCYVVITAFCLMFGIIIRAKTNESAGLRSEVRSFRMMVDAYVAFCAGEFVWAIGNFKLLPVPVPVLSAMSMVSMIAVGFITYFWFCYAEVKMGHRFTETAPTNVLVFIPLAAAIVLYVLSPWTGWMYYYDNAGQFVQGPLYPLAIPLEQVYLAVVSIQALVKALRTQGEKRIEYFNIFAFVIVPAAACIFDAFVPTMPVIAPAIFSSIFFVFMGLQESQIFNDALTGLNNRRRAEAYLDETIASSAQDAPLYVFMIDVNSFKAINDTYGHLEGDRALRVVAGAIRETCSELRAFAARWGGDEFMVVAEGSSIPSPEWLADALQASVENARAAEGLDYPLSVSVGYSACTSPATSKEQLEHAADEMLYAAKAAFYAA